MDRNNTLKSITQSLCDRPAEFVILPPIGARVPGVFEAVETSDRLHAELLSSAQRFRGGIYLQDGAVRPQQLTDDGRHELPVDAESWHVLTLDPEGRICACLRVHQEAPGRGFERLPVSQSALTHCPDWGGKLRQAVESEIASAREAQLHFGDVGGWAIAPERRRTLEPLRTILAGYSLMQQLGGVAGIVTATCKHGSAQILRKLGLRSLQADGEVIPGYYDPHYNSEMEVLSFDSRRPNPRYKAWIAELRGVLSTAPVIRAESRVRNTGFYPAAAFRPWNQVFFSRLARPLAD
jgi:hypothetical protein